MSKGEQKNKVSEALGVFESLAFVNLEKNNCQYYSRRKAAREVVYTELIKALYNGVCPLGDETATLEEYLAPVSIRRQLAQGRELLQWEYKGKGKQHRMLYALCIQREDEAPVKLLVASQRGGSQAEALQLLETMAASPEALAELTPDKGDDGTARKRLEQAGYESRRALVVEDNALSCGITEELLRMTGMEVETAANGREAVSRVANAPDGYYDVILMDMQMPVMNGYDAARAIRFLDKRQARRVPIVAMATDMASQDMADLGNELSGCLTKPICPSRLAEMLDRVAG